jgi:hypothetical protein
MEGRVDDPLSYRHLVQVVIPLVKMAWGSIRCLAARWVTSKKAAILLSTSQHHIPRWPTTMMKPPQQPPTTLAVNLIARPSRRTSLRLQSRLFRFVKPHQDRPIGPPAQCRRSTCIPTTTVRHRRVRRRLVLGKAAPIDRACASTSSISVADPS